MTVVEDSEGGYGGYGCFARPIWVFDVQGCLRSTAAGGWRPAWLQLVKEGDDEVLEATVVGWGCRGKGNRG